MDVDKHIRRSGYVDVLTGLFVAASLFVAVPAARGYYGWALGATLVAFLLTQRAIAEESVNVLWLGAALAARFAQLLLLAAGMIVGVRAES